MGGLGAQPVAGGEPEEAAEAQVGVGGDGAAAGDDLAYALGGDTDLFGQAVLGQAHREQELVKEQFAGGYGFEFGHSSPLMIIHDFHVMGAGGRPAKADAELIVDADAVLALPIAPERFQTVSGGDAEIVQPSGNFQLAQLSPRDVPQYR